MYIGSVFSNLYNQKSTHIVLMKFKLLVFYNASYFSCTKKAMYKSLGKFILNIELYTTWAL